MVVERLEQLPPDVFDTVFMLVLERRGYVVRTQSQRMAVFARMLEAASLAIAEFGESDALPASARRAA
jgi:hypothetical protein